ncbi:MAG: hypothetical protein HC868_17150 [Sphingomonadales bacterium]|nr:hypothetical protein [Sphingomonadales bacterium]
MTAILLVFWKMLTEIGALYPSAFWLAVFGPDPVRDLGPHGAIMLALYHPRRGRMVDRERLAADAWKGLG